MIHDRISAFDGKFDTGASIPKNWHPNLRSRNTGFAWGDMEIQFIHAHN